MLHGAAESCTATNTYPFYTGSSIDEQMMNKDPLHMCVGGPKRHNPVYSSREMFWEFSRTRASANILAESGAIAHGGSHAEHKRLNAA